MRGSRMHHAPIVGPKLRAVLPVARGPTRMELTFVVRVRDVITDAERRMNHPDTNSVRPYAFIVSFGVVSMLMDVVYQGALAVQGPLLASLGANALVIGIVSGLGEATGACSQGRSRTARAATGPSRSAGTPRPRSPCPPWALSAASWAYPRS